MDSTAACRNCGNYLAGRYCARCGQDTHLGHAPTLGHFLHDLTHEVLHVDGKIFRSLHALFLVPGLLTVEYWKGRIANWIRPLRLFLIAAAIHLLVAQHGVGPLNLQLALWENEAGERDISVGTDPLAETKPGRRPVPEVERAAYFEGFRKAYSSIRYLSVVGFAVFAWLLYRPQNLYFVSHLILGLHFYAFWYLLSAGCSLSVWLSKTVAVPLMLLYLVLMLRRIHRQPWPLTLAKSFALMCVLALIEGVLAFGALAMAGLLR